MNTQDETLAERHDAAVPLAPGRRLGDFLLTRVVGQGGFGIVYEAEDLSLQRRVAIKEYMPSQLATRLDGVQIHPISARYAKTFELGRQSFVGEARLLAQFRHPGLLEVLHFWEQNGTAYMVMPYYEGMTLDRVLASNPGIVSEGWLKETIAPVLDALEHMHAADCYHRDVSADNILILESGKALLLDLGAARRVIGDSGRALTVMLKPGYAPIEQYADDPACRQGPWTDIYALAAVLYFAVTGRMPQASASRVMHDSVPPLGTLQPPGYGLGFLEAIDRGMSIRPERRPRSIAEFRSLLYGRPAPGAGEGRSATPGAAPTGDARPRLRGAARRIPTPLLAAAAVVALAAGAYWLGSPGGADATAPSPAAVVADAASADRDRPPARAPATHAAPAPSGTAAASGAAGASGPTASPRPAASGQSPRATAERHPEPPSAATGTAATGVAATRSAATQAAATQAAATQPAAARPPATKAASTAKAAAVSAAAPSAVAPSAAAPGKTVAATGTVRLAVVPWGEVFVDGARKGITPPLKELSLSAGQHRIEVRNPASPTLVREVVVGKDRTTVLSHRFR